MESHGSSGYPASCGSGSLGFAAAVEAALEERRARGGAETTALSARLSELIVVGVVAVIEGDPGCPQN